MNQFEKDLEFGEGLERIVLEKIKVKYPQAYKIEGYCKEWDIYIPEKDIGVEVKGDRVSGKTGNIAIETSFNGKPSALTTTKATWWVYMTLEKLYWITPEAIKECVLIEGIEEREFGPIGGDNVPKTLFLIKEDTFAEYAAHIERR